MITRSVHLDEEGNIIPDYGIMTMYKILNEALGSESGE